jgi:hypothetical protein
MNLKDLQDKIDHPIVMPAHYESLLDEAGPLDWLRRLLGSPQNTPRQVGRTTRRNDGTLPIPPEMMERWRREGWDPSVWGSGRIRGRRRNEPWNQQTTRSGGVSFNRPADWPPGEPWAPYMEGYYYVPLPAPHQGYGWRKFENPTDVPREAFPQPNGRGDGLMDGPQHYGHDHRGWPYDKDSGGYVDPRTLDDPLTNPHTGEPYGDPPPWINPDTGDRWVPGDTPRDTTPQNPNQEDWYSSADDEPLGSTEELPDVLVTPPLKPGAGVPSSSSSNKLSAAGSGAPAARPTRTLQGLRTMTGSKR